MLLVWQNRLGLGLLQKVPKRKGSFLSLDEAKRIAAHVVVQTLFYPRALTVIYSYSLSENCVYIMHYASEQWGKNNQ